MDVKTVTLQIPASLYERYKQRAAQTQRSVEDEVLAVVSSVGVETGLSPELTKEIEALKLLGDKALRQEVRKRLPTKDARRAEQLHFKQGREGSESLTTEERAFLDDWLYRYDRHVLVRSHVLSLLKQRGYDLSEFLKLP